VTNDRSIVNQRCGYYLFVCIRSQYKAHLNDARVKLKDAKYDKVPHACGFEVLTAYAHYFTWLLFRSMNVAVMS
jgi:hypothetical protein